MSELLAQQLFGTPGTMARGVLLVLITLLLTAAASDISRQRIPNPLVGTGSALALLAHALLPAGEGFLSALPGGLGLTGALAGFGLTLIGLLPFYFMRLFGAGDVKLLAMVGAFVGVPEILWVLLFTALAGGLLTLAIALRRGLLPALLSNLRTLIWHAAASAGSGVNTLAIAKVTTACPVPYGVAIAAGSIAFLLLRAGQSGLIQLT